MKSLTFIAGILFAGCQMGWCETSLTDQFTVGLFQHTETIVETTTKGETYAELLATPIQIGHIDKGYIAGIDGGVLGNVAPQPGQGGVLWTIGIHFHLSPILKKYVFKDISPDYPAINGFEINPRVSLDFIDGHKMGVYGLSAGYAWGGTPQQ